MAREEERKERAEFFRMAANNRERNRQTPRSRIPRSSNEDISAERGRRQSVGQALYEAAQSEQIAMINYTKITGDRETKVWAVEPYSYRYRYLTGGGRWKPPRLKKVLFGWDIDDNHIKMFMYGNIHSVVVTPVYFYPRFKVEIDTIDSTVYGPIGEGGSSSPEY